MSSDIGSYPQGIFCLQINRSPRQRQALFILYRTLHFHLFTLQIFYRRSILSNNDCIFTDRVLQSIQRQHPIQSLLYSDLFHIQRNIGNLTDIVYRINDIISGILQYLIQGFLQCHPIQRKRILFLSKRFGSHH